MTSPGALAGLLVVETAERPAGEMTAKLLADFGAEVIKIERPGGAPTRSMGPFADGRSTLFAYLNTNKRSLVLDLATPADRATLDALLARAHGLIDDHDEDWCAAHGLVPGAYPGLVHCLVTPFGQGAPKEWRNARPINVINAGGWAWHSPSETPPDKPPLKGAGRFMPDYDAAIDAAIATSASLLHLRRSGKGQFIDISEVQTQINRVDCVLGRMLAGEAEPGLERTAYDMGGPGKAFAARDGYVYLFMTSGAHWQGLLKLMGEPDWATAYPADWLEFHCYPDRVADFRENFAAWVKDQPMHGVSDAGQKLGVAIVPVNSAADLPMHPQFIHRGFFQQLDGLAHPTVPYRLSATPVRLTSPAPTLGEMAHV
jgi:crotonobetainyl-CoA:carnitine CoA-transferase CaiB-like acyl-CoA transferase